MKKTLIVDSSIVVVLASVMIFLAVSAQAAECGPRARVSEFLAQKYREEVRAVGLVGTQGAMELYVSETGETWTVLISNPSGVSCIVAAGTSYQDVPAVYGQRPEPTPF